MLLSLLTHLLGLGGKSPLESPAERESQGVDKKIPVGKGLPGHVHHEKGW